MSAITVEKKKEAVEKIRQLEASHFGFRWDILLSHRIDGKKLGLPTTYILGNQEELNKAIKDFESIVRLLQ